MITSANSDTELVSLFRKPESRETAFTAIMKKFQEKLYWHIRRMVIQHDAADDVLQNTFIKAWRGLDNFKEQSSLYTWLYRIATNECLTYLDQEKKNAAQPFDSFAATLEDKIKSENNYSAGQIEWKLQLALQQLPEKQRLVFNLRYFDEMKYEDMSRVLDTSVGALKASYHHAVKKIEDYLLNRS